MHEKPKRPVLSRKYAIDKVRFRKLYFDRAAGKAFPVKFVQDYFVGPAKANLRMTGISRKKIGEANYRKIIDAYRRLGLDYIDFMSGKTSVMKHAMFSGGVSVEIFNALVKGGVPEEKRDAFLKKHQGIFSMLAADQQLLMLRGLNSNQ